MTRFTQTQFRLWIETRGLLLPEVRDEGEMWHASEHLLESAQTVLSFGERARERVKIIDLYWDEPELRFPGLSSALRVRHTRGECWIDAKRRLAEVARENRRDVISLIVPFGLGDLRPEESLGHLLRRQYAAYLAEDLIQWFEEAGLRVDLDKLVVRLVAWTWRLQIFGRSDSGLEFRMAVDASRFAPDLSRPLSPIFIDVELETPAEADGPGLEAVEVFYEDFAKRFGSVTIRGSKFVVGLEAISAGGERSFPPRESV